MKIVKFKENKFLWLNLVANFYFPHICKIRILLSKINYNIHQNFN